jgi:hypothetical protein
MDQSPHRPGRRWLKRLGAVGFLFFLVKGLLWLLVPLALMFWGFLGF